MDVLNYTILFMHGVMFVFGVGQYVESAVEIPTVELSYKDVDLN